MSSGAALKNSANSVIMWTTVTAHFKNLELKTSNREIKTCRVQYDIKEAKIVGNPSRKN